MTWQSRLKGKDKPGNNKCFVKAWKFGKKIDIFFSFW